MHYETSEAINQLKSKLEDFEHSNRIAETWFVKGLFYAITLLEHGKQEADSKLSNDKFRSKGAQIDELLAKAISILEDVNVSVESLSKIQQDLMLIQENLFT